MHKLNIKGFIPFSLSDWKIPSAVIFLGGCNYKCPTCHNKLLNCEKIIDSDFILKELLKYKKSVKGVVITGGEPLIQNIKPFLVKLKQNNFLIKVDTNGYSFDRIKDVINYVDGFSIDVKGPLSLYSSLIGIPINISQLKRTFNKIFNLAKTIPHKFNFRLTKVPLIKDYHIDQLKKFIPSIFNLKIQEYKEHGSASQGWTSQ